MVFEVSRAKREVVEKLVERDWTPTDLAAELGKSRTTVYNHLDDLHQRGLLSKTTVSAKTRPKTKYSIGDGFVQYVAVLPGSFAEQSFQITPSKAATLRVWDLPQEEFHPFVEEYWWRLRTHDEIDVADDVLAVAVYGSVARGEADDQSDVDVLLIARDEADVRSITEVYGTVRLEVGASSKIAMTEVFTASEYRESVAHGSDFLAEIQDELHVVYDPERVLRRPEAIGE